VVGHPELFGREGPFYMSTGPSSMALQEGLKSGNTKNVWQFTLGFPVKDAYSSEDNASLASIESDFV
jgi:hypothetical protein